MVWTRHGSIISTPWFSGLPKFLTISLSDSHTTYNTTSLFPRSHTMPFRHLLFSGQKRQRPAQPISLDSVRYWTIDSEFPTQTWQTDGIYQSSFQPNSADVQDVCMSKQPQSVAHIPYSFDPHNASSAHATYGTTYQPSPSDYEYDSHSLSYSDLLDTDVSSISQGSVHSSVSSTSHVDMMLDEDFDSVHSLSRKSSLASNTEFKAQQERLCPLLTGQVGKCNPSLCGPDAPCLQYINEGPTPIEECVQQNVEQLHISNPIPVDFTTPRTSPQALRHHSTPSLIQHNENTSESAALPTSFDDTRQLAGNNRASTKASSSNDENPRLRQNKKVRARQAHSLVI